MPLEFFERDADYVDKRASAPGHDMAPGYLKTWGIPLLAGRDFDEHNLGDGRNVLLINQAGAKKVFPNEDPIGKTLLVTSAGTRVCHHWSSKPGGRGFFTGEFWRWAGTSRRTGIVSHGTPYAQSIVR